MSKEPGFNIEDENDDEFMAVTEGLALAGQAMEDHSAHTVLAISLDNQGGHFAVLSGRADADAINQIENLLANLRSVIEGSGEDSAYVAISDSYDEQ